MIHENYYKNHQYYILFCTYNLSLLVINKLRFAVEFNDGIWENITYDMLMSVEVFKTWLAAPEQHEVREIIKKRAPRPNPRFEPPIFISWKAKPQESYMVEPDGIGWADLDNRLKDLLANNLNDVVIF